MGDKNQLSIPGVSLVKVCASLDSGAMDEKTTAQLRRHIEQMQLLLGDADKKTVRDLCETYFQDHRHRWAARTFQHNRRWRDLVVERFGGLQLAELSADCGRILRLDRATTGGHASEYLRRACRYGVKLGWLGRDPLETLSRWCPEARDRVLGPSELRALQGELERLVPSRGAPAAVGYLISVTGLSFRDARALRWDEVRARSGLLLPDRKGSGRRRVRIPDAAMEFVLGQPVRGHWVFPGRKDCAPVSETPVRTTWVAACAAVEIEDCTPHTLRHTLATRAAEAGAGVADLQDMFGWKSVESALHYVHPSGERLRDLANRIGPKSRPKSKGGRRVG